MWGRKVRRLHPVALAGAAGLAMWGVTLAGPTLADPPHGMRAPGPLSALRPPLGATAAPDYLSILRRPPASDTSAPFLAALNWYRTTVSPLDGPRCQMAPTCSLYAQQAFREYGLFGFILTADRLLHEADELGRVGSYIERGQRRYLDPLSANVYWLP